MQNMRGSVQVSDWAVPFPKGTWPSQALRWWGWIPSSLSTDLDILLVCLWLKQMHGRETPQRDETKTRVLTDLPCPGSPGLRQLVPWIHASPDVYNSRHSCGCSGSVPGSFWYLQPSENYTTLRLSLPSEEAPMQIWYVWLIFEGNLENWDPHFVSCNGTVDGSEILRSPVEVGSLSHCLHG